MARLTLVLKRVFVSLLLFCVCACTQVQPWERGTLAKREMMIGREGLHNKLDEHVYFSKEAANGGAGVSGGGCGCN